MSVVTDPQTFVDAQWLNMPYQLNGRERSGLDCIGLVLLWYREQGLVLPEINYTFRISGIGQIDAERGLALLRKGGPLAEAYQVYERWLQYRVCPMGVPVVSFSNLAHQDLIIFTAAPGAQHLGQMAICIQGRGMLAIEEGRPSFVEMLSTTHRSLFAVGLRFPQLWAGAS